MKILVIGASGMIGSTIFRVLSESQEHETFGTIRDNSIRQLFSLPGNKNLIDGIELKDDKKLDQVIKTNKPDIVINCAGITKHKPESEKPLFAIPINSLLPHRMAELCQENGARLIHISTDCVFSGKKGGYVENDNPDAEDLYGKSKALGEVNEAHTITLRTSTIGHELQSQHGLLNWFLSQEVSCKGYTRAIFSGLPTVVFARIIRDIVINHEELSGLYHIAAKPIAKFDLLKLIANIYGKSIEIIADDNLVIDRSLYASKFKSATGYIAPEWSDMIEEMYLYR
jgi:dTDP-4-dehydrorhamnose reductase